MRGLPPRRRVVARNLLSGWAETMSRTFPILVALVLAGTVLGPHAGARPAGPPPGWEAQADQALGAGRGVGRQLMTEEEWRAHHEQMRTLQGDERERVRREWHERMRERAKARGITLPETPGPHRGGPGGRGMGPGRGPGPGTP